MGKKPTFNVDTIVTILEMGEAILDNISNKQIDQALSIIDNRDRLINIFKLHANDNVDQKAISKILKQDREIIENLEKYKTDVKNEASTLSRNKTKIDRYRQVS